LLLVAIAGGSWLNFATAPIRAGAQDYNQEIAFSGRHRQWQLRQSYDL
jgi:hypothetical protein